MRSLIAAFLVLLACLPEAQAEGYSWLVLRVVDGDTILFDAAEDMPKGLGVLGVRLSGGRYPGKGQIS